MLRTPDFPFPDEKSFFRFPSVRDATPEGIVAVGGDLSPGMLLSAYRQGIFPWFSEGDPLMWWSPDPRFVMFPENIRVSKSMKRILKRKNYRVTLDSDFVSVIGHCKIVKRKKQEGTWITGEMKNAYIELHKMGYAHSVETFIDGELSGGLYGISLGSCFFGESMFSLYPDASKIALILLVWRLFDAGFTMVDCQVYTPHLERMGAENISRETFLRKLEEGLKRDTLRGCWGKEFADFPESRAYNSLFL